GTANGLNVLVEHFVWFRCAGRLLEIIVRRVVDRFAVHDIEERRDRRTIALAMTGPAGDDLSSREGRPIDGLRHLDHLARRNFPRRVGGPVRIVTLEAADAEGGGEDYHRPHELVHGNAFEQLHVLESFFRHLRPLWRPGLRPRLRICAGSLAGRLEHATLYVRVHMTGGSRRYSARGHSAADGRPRHANEPRERRSSNQPRSPRSDQHRVSLSWRAR